MGEPSEVIVELGGGASRGDQAVLVLDAELMVEFASRAIEPMLGLEPEDLVGRSIATVLADGAGDVLEALDASGSAATRPARFVRQVPHHDGSSRVIELAPEPMQANQRLGWALHMRDLTGRQDGGRALHESEQRFRSIAENVAEGLYEMTLCPRPRFEYVNPAMEQITGYSADRFMEDADLTLRTVHPDDRDLVIRTRTAPDTVAWPVEVRWRHPDRGWRWVCIRERITYDLDGTPIGLMGIVSDITGCKSEEEAVRNALDKERHVTERLREVDIMKSTFIQAVSHELRTPLTAIVGYSQTLNNGAGRLDGKTHVELLERLEFNANKLDRLLSDLLDVERLSSNTVEPVRRMVDVSALCRRTIDQIEDSTHPVTCTASPVEANVDAAKVERIVENLVRNAIKHTAPGTPITVDVQPDEQADGAIITVEDGGAGIPEDLRPTIFEPFVQGPGSDSSPQPGTGIGLALVSRFAQLHGGRVRIEEPTKGGTRFVVGLPGSRGCGDRAQPSPSVLEGPCTATTERRASLEGTPTACHATMTRPGDAVPDLTAARTFGTATC